MADSLPTKMRAVYQNEYAGLPSFKLGTLPRPSPGPGEVLVQVRAAALNPADNKRGLMGDIDEFPVVVGYDMAGVVCAVGEGDVAGLKVGDNVFGDVIPNGMAKKETGTLAEYTACPANILALVPDGKSFAEMAALPVAAGTAIRAFELGGVKQGDKVYISGGAGGVGIHAIQIVKSLFGASEVASTASSAKIDFVKQYGADIVINYKTTDAGKELPGWADVVLDCTAEIDNAQKIVKADGRVVSIAVFDQPDVITFPYAPSAAHMNTLAKLVADGSLKPVIDTVYPMDDALKAVEHVIGGHSKGKVIVQVSE